MKIGLSKKIITHNGFTYDAVDQGWYHILRGHTLFFIPNTLNQDFNLVANDLDSIILTGENTNNQNREVELQLIQKMNERQKPVLGIAESAFLVAELLGAEMGTVDNQNGLSHPIFYNREVIEVSSYHDRCIKSLPENVNSLCLDYAGNVESFISNNVSGVVWNPEKMDKPWIPPEIAYLLRI
jgi:gamma-glutamyl-gamma-aminobutyrate hydrolase PuuD